MNTQIQNGTKIKVIAGDRETVQFDSLGQVTNLKEDGSFFLKLKSSIGFYSNISEIGDSIVVISEKAYNAEVINPNPYAGLEGSILIDTDSYKVPMWLQYPEGTEYVYSYIESRGGKYTHTEFLGIQKFARRLAKMRITKAMVELADKYWTEHGEPFNKAGWMYIVEKCGGKLPIRIRAVKEGLIIPTKNVLCTIENTDPMVPWLTTWIETPALRAVWYATTVGTTSWYIKQEILSYLMKSGDPASINFKLHDFGSRGVSSMESAKDGGTAHLVNFMGTDTGVAMLNIIDTYGGTVLSGFSIPASEHSTITSWGRENAQAVRQAGCYSCLRIRFLQHL